MTRKRTPEKRAAMHEQSVGYWEDEATWRARIARHAYEARIRSRHPERADAILAGTDPAFNADLASWRALGRRKEGVA